MTKEAVTAALHEQAQTLHLAARSHKTKAAYHRRRASALSRQLDQLRAEAATFGITLEIDTAQKEAQS